MQFETKHTVAEVNILANDHYVGVPYDCSSITANADGVIRAGTVIPANGATAVGILLHDVVKKENPNGTIVVHGFIDAKKMPTEPTAEAISALKLIYFSNITPTSEEMNKDSEEDNQ